MFGIGAQETVVIGLLFLVVFGPSKLPQIARDLGRFVNQSRRQIDEFKSGINAANEKEGRGKTNRDDG